MPILQGCNLICGVEAGSQADERTPSAVGNHRANPTNRLRYHAIPSNQPTCCPTPMPARRAASKLPAQSAEPWCRISRFPLEPAINTRGGEGDHTGFRPRSPPVRQHRHTHALRHKLPGCAPFSTRDRHRLSPRVGTMQAAKMSQPACKKRRIASVGSGTRAPHCTGALLELVASTAPWHQETSRKG